MFLTEAADTSKAGWQTQHKKAKGMRRFFVSRVFQVQSLNHRLLSAKDRAVQYGPQRGDAAPCIYI